MTDLFDLWRALEIVPGLAATRKEWQLRTGDGFSLLDPILKPIGSVADSIPCFSQELGLHYHDVVEHSDGATESVFIDKYHDCRSFPVERHERAIMTPDMDALSQQISSVLGFESTMSALNIQEQSYKIGRYHPVESFNFNVILSLSPTTTRSEESLLCCAALDTEPFIFLTATPKQTLGKVETMLAARGIFIASLTESIAITEDHKLEATAVWKRTISRFRYRAVPSPGPAIAFFETPANSKWNDVSIRFVDGHTVFVSAGSTNGRFNYAEMGMANRKAARPSVRWEFLHELAENHGSIDFDMGNPLKNKSWKNGLSDDLRRFFHISDDPFVYDKTACCWQAKFNVICE